MFRSCQIIIRELCSLLKLYYSIHNSILISKRGFVAAYYVVWECVVVRKLPHNSFSLTICIYQEPTIYSHSYFDNILNSIIIYRYAATIPRLQIRIEL